MTQYRKRPVIIDAVKWVGHYNRMNFPMWFNEAWSPYGSADMGRIWQTDAFDRRLCISTLEGVMCVNVGDWIIKGIKGELYPCKPDIFAATYDEVDPPSPNPRQQEV